MLARKLESGPSSPGAPPPCVHRRKLGANARGSRLNFEDRPDPRRSSITRGTPCQEPSLERRPSKYRGSMVPNWRFAPMLGGLKALGGGLEGLWKAACKGPWRGGLRGQASEESLEGPRRGLEGQTGPWEPWGVPGATTSGAGSTSDSVWAKRVGKLGPARRWHWGDVSVAGASCWCVRAPDGIVVRGVQLYAATPRADAPLRARARGGVIEVGTTATCLP